MVRELCMSQKCSNTISKHNIKIKWYVDSSSKNLCLEQTRNCYETLHKGEREETESPNLTAEQNFGETSGQKK